jgi:hypothetical protein
MWSGGMEKYYIGAVRFCQSISGEMHEIDGIDHPALANYNIDDTKVLTALARWCFFNGSVPFPSSYQVSKGVSFRVADGNHQVGYGETV